MEKEKRKYFFVIDDNLQIYKVKKEAMEKCFKNIIDPLSIKDQINNKNISELLETLKKELKG